jgi:NADPH:quinone reductase
MRILGREDAVVIAKESDIAKEARRITEGGSVSVVYDGVEKDMFEANLESLVPPGIWYFTDNPAGMFLLLRLNEAAGKRVRCFSLARTARLTEKVSVLP